MGVGDTTVSNAFSEHYRAMYIKNAWVTQTYIWGCSSHVLSDVNPMTSCMLAALDRGWKKNFRRLRAENRLALHNACKPPIQVQLKGATRTLTLICNWLPSVAHM